MNSQVVAAKLPPAVVVRPGAIVEFDTAGSKPPLGPDAAYAWSNGLSGDHPTAVFDEPGVYRVTLTISAFGAEASAERIVRVVGTSEPPFLEAGGKVVMEAEDDALALAVDAADAWTSAPGAPGAAGAGSLTSPGTGKFTRAGYSALAPELVYPVRFAGPGDYTLWVRARGSGTGRHSLAAALDSVELPLSRNIVVPTAGEFAWTSGAPPAGPVVISVPTDGPLDRLLSIYVREPGVELDRVLLAADPAYVPEDAGPPESLRAGQSALFVRGDATGDGALDISNAIAILARLFQGAPPPSCPEALDSNDDGSLDLTDAVVLLSHLFQGGPAPPPPSPTPASTPRPTAWAAEAAGEEAQPARVHGRGGGGAGGAPRRGRRGGGRRARRPGGPDGAGGSRAALAPGRPPLGTAQPERGQCGGPGRRAVARLVEVDGHRRHDRELRRHRRLLPDTRLLPRARSPPRRARPLRRARCGRAAPGAARPRPSAIPSRFPRASIFTRSAAGTLGRPGMVRICPATATTNPAPAESVASLIVMSNPSGAPRTLGLSVKDIWVFAMQTGTWPKPMASISVRLSFAAWE